MFSQSHFPGDPGQTGSPSPVTKTPSTSFRLPEKWVRGLPLCRRRRQTLHTNILMQQCCKRDTRNMCNINLSELGEKSQLLEGVGSRGRRIQRQMGMRRCGGHPKARATRPQHSLLSACVPKLITGPGPTGAQSLFLSVSYTQTYVSRTCLYCYCLIVRIHKASLAYC